MVWDYRVVRTEEAGEVWLSIHEVYYHDDGSLWTYTTNPVHMAWEESENGEDVLYRMKKAMETPVLTPEMFNTEEEE
jgi:hypothetical protein